MKKKHAQEQTLPLNTGHSATIHTLPATGYLRLRQIIGDHDAGLLPIIPVSKSTWWQGVKDGRFPQPVKLGPKTTAWRAEDIRALLERLGQPDHLAA